MGKKRITNRHHVAYGSEEHPEQEWTEVLFKGEHLAISRLIWWTRKSISMGLIRSLEYFVLRNKGRATELDKSKSPTLLDIK